MSNRILAAALAAALALPAAAQTFRWANDGDANSMDPYGRNETFLLTFTGNMYEPLVRRNRTLELEPALALRWEQPSPTVWRFHLRPDVRFHEGEPFTADDVLFSYERVRGPGSNLSAIMASVKEARVTGPLTIEFETHVPNPIFVQEITNWGIMSRAWATRHGAARSADLTSREENHATRHANGTGPFILAERAPDQRTILRPNPNWWDTRTHNLQRVEFNVIANNATRIAALISGEVDMVYTVPPQDMERIGRTAGLRLIEGPELRTMYLGFDQLRPQLLKSDVQGRNPFQDRRVREAFYYAIDMSAIATRIMRGQARITNLMVGPGVNGFDETLDRRPPADPDRSRRLLTEAGYPNGFGVTMDCPNDRYVNDEQICQAIVAMLARVGVRVNLNAQTRLRFFAEVNAPNFNTSFYLLGWTPATYDAHNMLFNLMGSRNGVRGNFNNGGYANPEMDALIDRIAVETDAAARQRLISDAFRLAQRDFAYIPLHQQTVVWAARQNVELVQLADNTFPMRFVRMRVN
jgi:peptide/nickel transport system substrate-binding protein